VLNPEDEDSKAIDSLNRKIAKDARVEGVLLTIRDGIMLVRKN
jgi:predicted O-methyltransferase YrrM